MKILVAKAGNVLIGSGHPIVVQTMCNTHTSDIEATVEQCRRMKEAGAEMIRITVPGLQDVSHIKERKQRLRSEEIDTPIVADIHFSSATAIAVASVVEKVRINPGNFHKDHEKAKEQFARFIEVCKENGTAVRVGINHGSLGEYITNLYGNTPVGMAKAAMEWLDMCVENDFYNVVVSLKASNTLVMVEAYRLLYKMMQEKGLVFPLHVGVTEAGNGDSGRIKSCVGISTILSEGIGDTVRVSLTEDPVREIPVARYLSDRYDHKLNSSLTSIAIEGKKAVATYHSPSRERLIEDLSCDFGKRLLDRELDDIKVKGSYLSDEGVETEISEEFGEYLADELLQACRRRFYRPEYVACPGCGRTMFDLQTTVQRVQRATAHLTHLKIGVMGCIVNGPGEMADADYGYVGAAAGRISLYKGKQCIEMNIPEDEAIERLVGLIKQNGDWREP